MNSWLWSLAAIVAVCAVFGCKQIAPTTTGPQGEARVVGDFKGEFVQDDGKHVPGANMTFTSDHHFRELYRNTVINGVWRLTGDDLSLTIETVGALTVEEAKKKYLESATGKDAGAYRSMAENLDKPTVLKISADGKTLSRDEPQLKGRAVYTRE